MRLEGHEPERLAKLLHHGAVLNQTLITAYLKEYLPLVKLFMPDITIGTKEKTYSQIYETVVHEMAHASHYAQAGNSFWTPYINYILLSFVTESRTDYRSGTAEGANYCELGEMWAYFMHETLKKDRYGGTVRQFGNTFWFKPDIFTYLYERGISRGEIFRALKAEVTTIEDLKEELIAQLPERESIITQTFQHYGK